MVRVKVFPLAGGKVLAKPEYQTGKTRGPRSGSQGAMGIRLVYLVMVICHERIGGYVWTVSCGGVSSSFDP